MGCTNSTVKLEENNGYKNEDKDKLSSDYHENNLLSTTTIQEAPLQSDGVKNENLDNKNQCDDAESIRVSLEPNFTLIQKEFPESNLVQHYDLVMIIIS